MNLTANTNGGVLSYITLYPTGQPQPNASMLNDFQGKVVSNSAIVPAGTNGSIDIYASDHTDLQLMIGGYFFR